MKILKALVASAFLCAMPAMAATVTTTLQFTASDFVSISTGEAAPDEPAISGSFTLSYDDGHSDFNADLPIDSGSLTIGGHVYDAGEIGFRTFVDEGIRAFWVGGFANGGLISVERETDDFLLAYGLPPTPFMIVTRPGVVSAVSTVPTVSILSMASAVPEPASWALMIGGFGLIGGLARRRGVVPARA